MPEGDTSLDHIISSNEMWSHHHKPESKQPSGSGTLLSKQSMYNQIYQYPAYISSVYIYIYTHTRIYTHTNTHTEREEEHRNHATTLFSSKISPGSPFYLIVINSTFLAFFVENSQC